MNVVVEEVWTDSLETFPSYPGRRHLRRKRDRYDEATAVKTIHLAAKVELWSVFLASYFVVPSQPSSISFRWFYHCESFLLHRFTKSSVTKLLVVMKTSTHVYMHCHLCLCPRHESHFQEHHFLHKITIQTQIDYVGDGLPQRELLSLRQDARSARDSMTV